MNKDRNFVIERLEKQVIENENKVIALKTSIKEEIIQEILPELLTHGPKKDRLSIIEDRMIQYENKIKELSNIITGVTNELLDQKSILNSFEKIYSKKENIHKVPDICEVKNKDQHHISTAVNHSYKIQIHNKEQKKHHNINIPNTIPKKPKSPTYIIASDNSMHKNKKINDKKIEYEDECREDEGVIITTIKK